MAFIYYLKYNLFRSNTYLLLSVIATRFQCLMAVDESGSVKRIAANIAGSPTLLVTELEGLSCKGSCINFIIVDDHLKLEINKANIEHRDLNTASELLSLGIIVK